MSDRDVVATPAPGTPPSPAPQGGPDKEWPYRELYESVIDAIHALPGLFKTSLNIVGVRATDLHTLSGALGASIEKSAVESLNELRAIWDTRGEHRLYSFVRQAQAWPDVLLCTDAPGQQPRIIMGIELKGWFVLAKEGEPSFRYKVSPAVCSDADLLVVLPWILDEVISGTPRLLRPFVAEARYAAEVRNYYWRNLRRTRGTAAEIAPASYQLPYPPRGTKFLDVPRSDPGGNFGRVARGGLMAQYAAEVMAMPAAGIPLAAWQRFFTIFTDGVDEPTLRTELAAIGRAYADHTGEPPEMKAAFAQLSEALVRLARAAEQKAAEGGSS